MISLYQIFYDSQSKLNIPDCCIPLDNTSPSAEGWFEFLPILNYLQTHVIKPEDFYGFISPNFQIKTGISPADLIGVVKNHGDSVDAFISNYCWDQTAFFKNAWEQGEFWHPGLTSYTQDFLDYLGLHLNISNLVGHKMNTVASNYVVARGRYWLVWKQLSEKFVNFLESNQSERRRDEMTCYASPSNIHRMAVFVQERFASLILSLYSFKTFIFDENVPRFVFDRLFIDTKENINMLNICEDLKYYYSETKDLRFLRAWEKVRGGVLLNFDRPV
jgi:hypothetical protein